MVGMPWSVVGRVDHLCPTYPSPRNLVAFPCRIAGDWLFDHLSSGRCQVLRFEHLAGLRWFLGRPIPSLRTLLRGRLAFLEEFDTQLRRVERIV
jgi:hypothetical protein